MEKKEVLAEKERELLGDVKELLEPKLINLEDRNEVINEIVKVASRCKLENWYDCCSKNLIEKFDLSDNDFRKELDPVLGRRYGIYNWFASNASNEEIEKGNIKEFTRGFFR